MKQFRIYQLPIESNAKFMGLDFVTEHNIMPKLEDYNMVGESELYEKADATTTGLLDSIFSTLNTCHPDWFKGHSLSVSDIVELDGKFYYCDSFGWEQVFQSLS